MCLNLFHLWIFLIFSPTFLSFNKQAAWLIPSSLHSPLIPQETQCSLQREATKKVVHWGHLKQLPQANHLGLPNSTQTFLPTKVLYDGEHKKSLGAHKVASQWKEWGESRPKKIVLKIKKKKMTAQKQAGMTQGKDILGR